MITICKTCGMSFNSDTDEFDNPLQDECNSCWAENECKHCKDKDCEHCDTYYF
ncbi:MAG: hypothetical protein WC365_00810 [Candidatus Babeliales bacterium]|jgi:hypothetical protein